MAVTKAILFDLDDTILSAYANPGAAWLTIAEEFAAELAGLSPIVLAEAVTEAAVQFLADRQRSVAWRLQAKASRRLVARTAFETLAQSGQAVPPITVADAIADRYFSYRDENMYLFDDAHLVIDTLKARGYRLALITNGAADVQRAKLARFDLADRFEYVQIEEEAGYGKPEQQAYIDALAALGLDASEVWMVGDDLEGDIAAPSRMGISVVWHDVGGEGLPPDTDARPDVIVRALIELLDHFPAA